VVAVFHQYWERALQIPNGPITQNKGLTSRRPQRRITPHLEFKLCYSRWMAYMFSK
jgi:hypothetical protein